MPTRHHITSHDDLKLFNRLIADYRNRFIRFADTYVHDTGTAEDFTMEAFMYYWENRATLNDNTNPPAYILTIIKHKCLNYLQHLRTQKQTAENLMDIAQWELSTQIATLQACEPNELFTAEIQSIIAETLNSLPPRTQAIFRMHRYDRLTQKKIAETMHLSVKTIEFHINKAVQALRVALKDYIPAVLFFLHF